VGRCEGGKKKKKMGDWSSYEYEKKGVEEMKEKKEKNGRRKEKVKGRCVAYNEQTINFSEKENKIRKMRNVLSHNSF